MAGEVFFSGLFVFGFLAMAMALVSFRHLWWLKPDSTTTPVGQPNYPHSLRDELARRAFG